VLLVLSSPLVHARASLLLSKELYKSEYILVGRRTTNERFGSMNAWGNRSKKKRSIKEEATTMSVCLLPDLNRCATRCQGAHVLNPIDTIRVLLITKEISRTLQPSFGALASAPVPLQDEQQYFLGTSSQRAPDRHCNLLNRSLLGRPHRFRQYPRPPFSAIRSSPAIYVGPIWRASSSFAVV
jgi:hypothetical protein